MGKLNSDTNRVYTVMHKSLKCGADEAKQWKKGTGYIFRVELNN